MIGKIFSTLKWLPSYLTREILRTIRSDRGHPTNVYFCICDHFEPYWNGASRKTASQRIQRWLKEYPKIADTHLDSKGERLKYSFFYPEEEYYKDDLDILASLCHAGYGEVEIHLHHDNDTSENLRRTLIDYKKRLYENHGLLSVDKETGEIVYGFIHGNWALDNSRPDGRWCGVNDEITILKETGCFADFTMPSAPSDTQTRKVNSIYYAIDEPERPKSHDWGRDAEVGCESNGLLMIQGPLALDWGRRKFGVFPRIEHSGLMGNFPPSPARIAQWINAGISLKGSYGHVFVKLYTHGTQEDVMEMFFGRGHLASLLQDMTDYCSNNGINLHFLSARELANVVLAQQAGNNVIGDLTRNIRYLTNFSHQMPGKYTVK